MAWILDCDCLDVLILGSKRNLDHRSFLCLIRYVNELIQIISFFEQRSFKLKRETVIGIVLCYSHQACCLLYYLCEIASKNAFTSNIPEVFVVSNLNKILADQCICRKKARIAGLHNPIHLLMYVQLFSNEQT